MKKLFLTIALVCLVSSCSFIDNILHGDVVARVGSSLLYEKEIEGLVPKGTSPEDSAAIVKHYITTWATKKLLLANAENRLSREDRDVEQEINDYRSALLVYRYENRFVEKNLDTLISEAECREYYNTNKHSFTHTSSVVKGRFIKINLASPNVKILESIYSSKELDDLDEVERIANNSADRFIDCITDWIPLSYVAKEFGEDLSFLEGKIDQRWSFIFERGSYLYLIKVFDRVKPGQITPYDFNIDYIKESILSRRKQELILNLEKDLLEDALNNNKLIIYSKDND